MKTDCFIDSHCHLDWKSFSGEQETIIARAKNVSVGGMLSINTHPKHFPSLHELVRSYDTVWCSVGVHPCYINKEQDDDETTLMSVLSDYARYEKTVAIGETGLDYKEAQADADKQKRFFTLHLRVACACNLPVIIHLREAEDDFITFMESFRQNHPELRAVLHCFNGSAVLARKAVQWGFYLSLSGLVTYKSCQFLHSIIQEDIPLERLLLETDAPFLAPTPKRGARNEPAFLVYTAETVARLKNISLAQLARVSHANFFRLFARARLSS